MNFHVVNECIQLIFQRCIRLHAFFLFKIVAGPIDRIWSISWSRDGKFLAAASADKTITIIGQVDLEWKIIYVIKDAHTKAVFKYMLHRVMCCYSFKHTHTQLHNYTIYTIYKIRHISWSSYNHLLAAASFDGSISIWEPNTECTGFFSNFSIFINR